jgi:hypothetical protein
LQPICLRRSRRLLHPAKDDRTQPYYLMTGMHAKMSRAKTITARKADLTRRRKKQTIEQEITEITEDKCTPFPPLPPVQK